MKSSTINFNKQPDEQRDSVRPFKNIRVPMKYFLVTLLTIISIRTLAQNNNIPYSQMGLGDLEDGYYNRTSGLANTGIAYRSNRFLINNNPASFSALSDQYFTMEIGLRGQYIHYAGTP